ncbi:acyl-homoserine-lactone synthase [Candidatus Nitrotoga sp. M5]|uniref:acyl-homoserine-lactone synthase n=1 Tax=Candidatus Nitrotoga sp. M5 TaxID=2890409 RepID=UPI001EF72686|nr:acyl-homoserine-lactone synthase [Candidatus Nitrotoga sp. M5]CAH1387807.1 Acyl-homoserine-lactone synthase [Candidatus Nitrotoga sp. M5]
MRQIMLAQHGDGALDNQTALGMYRLRHEVFHDRLGWDVNSDNGMEHDEFDEANPVYVLVKNEGNEVQGCWRLLPTTGPNMLRDTFSELLHGQPAPQQDAVWELSRFAMLSSKLDRSGYGLSNTPIQMIQAAVRFAQKNGIERYVSVTSVAVERMFLKLGISMTRLGAPIKIGRILTVACTLEIDEITEFALFGTLPEHKYRLAA